MLTYLEVFTHTRTHEVATDNKGDGVPSPALGTIKQDSLQAVEEGVTICPCVPRLAGKDGTSPLGAAMDDREDWGGRHAVARPGCP